jgi:integrase
MSALVVVKAYPLLQAVTQLGAVADELAARKKRIEELAASFTEIKGSVPASCHQLRHTMATQMLNADAPQMRREYHRPHRPNRLEITPVLASFKQDEVLRA